MGLLDNFNMDDPKALGLLRSGLSMLGNSGASRSPVNLGQILGGGLETYASTQDEFRRRKQQEEENAYMQQMRDFKMNEIKQGIADRESSKKFQAQIPKIINQFGNDYQGMIKAGVPQELVKSIAESANYGRSKVARTMDVEGQDGSKLTRQFDEYGNAVGSDVNAYVAPVSTNLGDRVVFNKPIAGQSLPMGRSPDSVATNNITMRGQNMTDARARDMLSVTRENKDLEKAQKLEEKALAKELDSSSKIASFDTMLDSLARLKDHKGLSRSVGLYSATPTLPGSDSANFQAELDTFQSQAFLPMVSQLKGMGALSDAEGKKLTAAVGALNPRMSEEAFKSSLNRINTEMKAAKNRVLISAGKSPDSAPKASMRFNPATGKLERVE